jgi:translocation and assembly module TamA
VRIDITVDSGPSVRLGPLNVTGADKYGSLQAARLARLMPNQLYRQSELLEAQQRLVASGFYDSVWVSLVPDSPADATPVKIELKETLRQKWVLGLGVRSDSGGRLTVEHTHHSVPGLRWRTLSKLALDKNLQSIGLDLLAPPDSGLWRWNLSAKLDHEKLQGYQINSQRWRAGRTQHGDRMDRSYFAQYDTAQLRGNLSAQQESISGNVAWTWRQFDNLPFPDRGLGIGVELGTGVTLGAQHEPYVRWRVKGLGVLPLSKSAGRLAVRAEMGSVVSRDPSSLPYTQLFLTGGDNSVRGYMPNSIGIDLGDGLVVAGRYLNSGSVEWQRPITWKQKRTEWESAVFVDAGAVADDIKALKTHLGYGVGVRWRSPVGPVRMDLAYAHAHHKLRLHLSVGFTF